MLRRLWARDQAERFRGGWRQRELQGEGRAEVVVRSKAASAHLLDWCRGDLSASRLQEHMLACAQDGLSHPAVVRLSRCRGGNNAQRDLLDLIEERVGLAGLQTAIDNPADVTRRQYIQAPIIIIIIIIQMIQQ